MLDVNAVEALHIAKLTNSKQVEQIRSRGGEAVYIRGEMANENSVKELHEKAIAAWGYLDAAVNNAGISNDAALFADLKTENFRQMFDVNVLGVFWAMQHQIRHMESRGYGRIINLASIAGRRGILYQGSYVATKHAVSMPPGQTWRYLPG